MIKTMISLITLSLTFTSFAFAKKNDKLCDELTSKASEVCYERVCRSHMENALEGGCQERGPHFEEILEECTISELADSIDEYNEFHPRAKLECLYYDF